MTDTKLMNYITSDFQTKSDMKVGEIEWEKIINERFNKFKKAGAVRQTVSQIWNKEGTLRLGHLWEYKDEKSFIECQKILEKQRLSSKKEQELFGRFFQTGALFFMTLNINLIITNL